MNSERYPYPSFTTRSFISPPSRSAPSGPATPSYWRGEEFRVWTTAVHEGRMVETWWRILDGRPEPVEVRVRATASGSEPVTAQLIRQLPLGEMLKQSRAEIRGHGEVMSQDPSWSGELSDPVVVDEVGSLSESLVTRKPQRGQLLTGDVLAEVARVYREAWKDDKPTNEAVRKAFHLSKDGAAKRIGKARRAGLLDGIGPKR